MRVASHRQAEFKRSPPRGPGPDNESAELPFGSSAIVWGPSWRLELLRRGVADEARTRGFAAPAFTGWALVEE